MRLCSTSESGAKAEPGGHSEYGLPNPDSFHKVSSWQQLLEDNGSEGAAPSALPAADAGTPWQQQPPAAHVPPPGPQLLLQAVEQQPPSVPQMRDPPRVPVSKPSPRLDMPPSPGQVPEEPVKRFQRYFSLPSVGAPAPQGQELQLTVKAAQLPPSARPPQPSYGPHPATASRQLQPHISVPKPHSQPPLPSQPWRLHLMDPVATAMAAGPGGPEATPEPAAGGGTAFRGKAGFASEIEGMLKGGAPPATALERGVPGACVVIDRAVSLPRCTAVAAADRVALGPSLQPPPDSGALVDRVMRRQSSRLGTSWRPPKVAARSCSIRAEKPADEEGQGLVRKGSIGVVVTPATSSAPAPVGVWALIMAPRSFAPGTVQTAWVEQGDNATPPRRASLGGGYASPAYADQKW